MRQGNSARRGRREPLFRYYVGQSGLHLRYGYKECTILRISSLCDMCHLQFCTE